MLNVNELSYPLLLDGGLSNQLEFQGHDLNDPLWSAKLMAEDPAAIYEAHLAYLQAGAQILITASYQASIQGFKNRLGVDKNKAEELLFLTTQVARDAIQKFREENQDASPRYVAASIGPYGAYLADGSEYHGNYGVSNETLTDFHRERLDILARSEPDFLACETIPSFQEASVLSELLKEYNIPAWISFSCMDDVKINDEARFSVAIQLFKDHPTIFALGVNCTAPEHVTSLIRIAKSELPEKKVIVYPNSGEVFDAETKTWSGLNDTHICAMMSNEWLNAGADIVGGCCRIGPKHIAAIRSIIESR